MIKRIGPSCEQGVDKAGTGQAEDRQQENSHLEQSVVHTSSFFFFNLLIWLRCTLVVVLRIFDESCGVFPCGEGSVVAAY